MTKCSATTAKGTPCRNAAKAGSDRCSSHSGTVGRPSQLLTPEVSDKILDAVSIGAYLEVAAEAAGIRGQTVRNWVARGEEHAGGSKIPTRERPYVAFFEAYKATAAQAEVDLLRLIRANADGSWQRYMTILERKHFNRWGRKERVEHSGEVKHTVGVDLPDGTADELHELADSLAARRGD